MAYVYCGAMSIMVKIYDTDSPHEIARKIFYDIDVMASVSIYGFYMNEASQKLVPKGEIILEQLKQLDEEENLSFRKDRTVRKYRFRPDSIGGPIAHKIFTWEKRVVDDEPRYTIWRYQ